MCVVWGGKLDNIGERERKHRVRERKREKGRRQQLETETARDKVGPKGQQLVGLGIIVA